MKLCEQKYTATRGTTPESYQTVEVIMEAAQGHAPQGRITMKLMENRWRSVAEAADYLRWAANEIETLKSGGAGMKTLWADCKNDEDRIEFLLSGRAYNTGIIAQAIVNDVACVFRFRIEAWARMAELEEQVSELKAKFMEAGNEKLS